MSINPELNRSFRRISIGSRREKIGELLGTSPDWDDIPGESPLIGIADNMVEVAIGLMAVPIGILRSININNKNWMLPMATEEPSVIAAANFGAFIINRRGTITASAAPSLMTAQVYLQNPPSTLEAELKEREGEILNFLKGSLESMTKRGGGFRGISYKPIRELNLLRIHVDVDVRDAQGANLLNTVAEKLKTYLHQVTGLDTLLAILTNNSSKRLGKACFSIPVKGLDRGGYSAEQIGRRIVLASEVARVDPDRAVTHNKGIMNGITAFALATGNDTRALEGAVHAYACRDGSYRGLSNYSLEGDTLTGSLELPLPLASIGGSVNHHPASRGCLKLMGNPGARELATLGAALGLVQNFAALYALVSEGIQAGHMKLHNRKSNL